jgi:hypothetical protein
MPNSAPLKAKILITDMSPLITLAAAGDLDVLLYADLPVIIPDALFYEAAHDASRLGAQTILEWRNANKDKVNLVGATVFSNYLATGQKPKGLGELSAQEAIQTLPVGPDARALLLMEDPKAVRIINPRSVVITLSTRDYLEPPAFRPWSQKRWPTAARCELCATAWRPLKPKAAFRWQLR